MSLGVGHTDVLRALRVVAHPLRLRMLSLVTAQPMSASELARELGVSHALASYHLRELGKAAVVEVAERRSYRGGMEVRYRYRPPPPTNGAVPPGVNGTTLPATLILFAEALSTELRRRSAGASPLPGLSPLVADAQLWLTPSDWAELRRGLDLEVRRIHELAKAPHSTGTVCVSVSAAAFEVATELPGRSDKLGQR